MSMGKVHYFAAAYSMMSYYSFGNLAEKRVDRQKDIVFEIFRLTIGLLAFNYFAYNTIFIYLVKSNLLSIVALVVGSVLTPQNKNKTN